MYQYGLISCNESTILMPDVIRKTGWGVEGVFGNSVLFAQLLYKPQMSKNFY